MTDRFAYCPEGIEEIYLHDDKIESDRCVVFLAGRGQSGRMLADAYKAAGEWDDVLVFGITPQGHQWYPMPFGANNQEHSLQGLQEARGAIEDVLRYIEGCTGLQRHSITLAGFSAGGVMAIEVASHSEERFEVVACHAGAILDPASLPSCRHPSMPVLLTHSFDDDCFEWHERYWPMKKALIDQGYNLHVNERAGGGHDLLSEDSLEVSRFVRRGSSHFEKV